MRYPASEKLEIIRLVEQSHLPVRRTLAKISIPPTTFYRWYDRFVEHGPEGLEDRPSSPSRVWNRIPDAVRDQIVTLALEEPERGRRAVHLFKSSSVAMLICFTPRDNTCAEIYLVITVGLKQVA